MISTRTRTLIAIIVLAALSRLIPHPANVTPIAALALFAGAHFERKSLAFIVPIAAMIISDTVIGLHGSLPFVYAAMALIVAFGIILSQNINLLTTACWMLAGSVSFFLISNFGSWVVMENAYPHTWEGLVACYVAALPFFTNTLAGDAFYAAILFGGFALAQQKYPTLQKRASA